MMQTGRRIFIKIKMEVGIDEYLLGLKSLSFL